MNQAFGRWGIELHGPKSDREAWQTLLKPPFDPFVEAVNDERGDYLVLRSSAFDGFAASQEVHNAAKQLISILNVVMSKNADAESVTIGPVVEFIVGGPCRKHHYVEVEESVRLRDGFTMTLTDGQGNVIEPLPAPSRAQLWMRAAALEPEIGSALRYMEGKPGWLELYKAYEAIRKMPHNGIRNSEIERFKQTANAGERHHPNEINKPHKHPMELWEARAFITQWISVAIDDTLAKNP